MIPFRLTCGSPIIFRCSAFDRSLQTCGIQIMCPSTACYGAKIENGTRLFECRKLGASQPSVGHPKIICDSPGFGPIFTGPRRLKVKTTPVDLAYTFLNAAKNFNPSHTFLFTGHCIILKNFDSKS